MRDAPVTVIPTTYAQIKVCDTVRALRSSRRVRMQRGQERTMSVKAAAALVYVDKGIDNVADLDPDLSWTNAEVIELLEDVRSLLVTGRLTEGSFRGETNERGSDVRSNAHSQMSDIAHMTPAGAPIWMGEHT